MNIDQVDRAVHARTAPAAVPARSARPEPAVADAQALRETAALAEAGRAASVRLRQAISEANRQLAEKGSELTFEFDENAQRVIVRLIDTRTGEVLRQIPSEEALAIASALRNDMAAGALLRTDA